MSLICSPYVANVLVPCPQYARVTVKADLIFENYVGLDVHAMLVISREVSSNITQARRNENNYTIPKEININNDNHVRNLLDKSEENKDLEDTERAPTSLPSFDLLQDEMNEDLAILEPGEMESKPKKDESIFDHIRRKSKIFPDLITLKTMDVSHKPANLTEVNNYVDQSGLDSSNTQEDCVILMDSEPVETIITSMDQCDFHTAKAQADDVILIDKDPVNNLTESNDAPKYTQNSDVHLLDTNSFSIIIDQLDKKQSFNLIENSTDSEISSDVSYYPNNQLNERKRIHNWINDVIVKDCKRHKSEPSSDSCSTRSCDLPSSRIKPEGSELCDLLVPNSSLGAPSGSLEVSFLGFKSVFSFL